MLTKVYISVEDENQQLVVNGSLELFDRLLTTLHKGQKTEVEPSDTRATLTSQSEHPAQVVAL